jgi:hypothetical protein
MARQKIADEIEALRRHREQLDAKLKAAEAKQKDKERQDNERRKVIAGGLVLEHIAANPDSEFARVFSDLVNKAVSRSIDRALFSALLSSKAPPETLPTNSSKTDPERPAPSAEEA